MDERDYRRGPGRADQRDKRGIPEGEAAFRAGFLLGPLRHTDLNGPLVLRGDNVVSNVTRLAIVDDRCDHCDVGAKLITMRRQRVHYVDRRIFVCTKD